MNYKIPPINLWNVHAWSKMYKVSSSIINKSTKSPLLNNKIKELHSLRSIN